MFSSCSFLPHDLSTDFHPRGPTILLCPCSCPCRGTGISTCCPSCTPFGLHLGPDLPWVDEPSPGNLRLSTEKFLTFLSLLMPAFSLPYDPPSLTLWLLLLTDCSSTDSISTIPRLRCQILAPVIFGAWPLDQ